MHEEEIIYDLMRERDKLQAEVERLRAELEKERMRLAVCGVVAMSNTKESLSKVMAEIHPSDYFCASVDDVKRAVEREIELRAELAEAKAASVVTEMKWQPMETAPKDGTVIVLATTVRVAESSWGVCRPQWDGYVANEGKPCWRASGEEKVRGGDPLCWMPMPQLTPNDRMKERRE